MMAAIIPAVLFYLAVFVTVHLVALRRGLAIVPEEELPAWNLILAPRRVLPIVAALGGLGIGIWLGRSVATSAFYGIMGLLVAFATTQAGQMPVREMAGRILTGLVDAGKGLVIIGVLLAGAQVLVSMINLTGIGVTLSSLIVTLAGDNVALVALVVAFVCLIMGMGLPTTAAYVLVAAVLAPAMTAVGVEPLAAHLFVFYFATISVITPPVCVTAVFVGARGLTRPHGPAPPLRRCASEAVTYVVPFMLLLYPRHDHAGRRPGHHRGRDLGAGAGPGDAGMYCPARGCWGIGRWMRASSFSPSRWRFGHTRRGRQPR